MKRHLYLTSITSILVLSAFFPDANAVTISITGQNTTVIPTTNFITTPDSTFGPFNLSTTGSIINERRSPYQGTSIPNTPYSILSEASAGFATATFNCSGCTGFGLLWGSPDVYNSVNFYSGLNGTGTLIATFTGSNLVPPATGLGFNEVTFSSLGTGTFNSVVLRDSGQAAFEYSNVSVPGPIAGTGLAGFVAACFGLIGLAWRRRVRTATV
jgi:hypothetical protein